MRIVAKHLTGARRGESDAFEVVPLTIGRLPASDLRLGINDTRASARHAEIVVEKRDIVLRDVGSTNGTFVNGRRLQSAVLNSGDIVEFGTGGPKLQFQIEGPVDFAAAGTNGTPSKRRISTPASREMEAQASGIVSTLPEHPAIGAILAGDREFVIKSKFKYYLVFPGISIFCCGLVILFYQNPLLGLPLMLAGLFMLITGLAMGRKNITITRRGIHQEGMFSTRMIPWDEVEHLSSQRSRTQVLTHQVYVVHGRRAKIMFTPTGYSNGMELISIISRQSGLRWQ
jgi:pSer/pThr/pTyr-binding forkhead associated (FHA) protein